MFDQQPFDRRCEWSRAGLRHLVESSDAIVIGDGSLRPAFEALLGVGAIVRHLTGTRSPETAMAEATFLHFQHDMSTCLQHCGSGKELISQEFAEDVTLAAALDESDCVPVLTEGAYVPYSTAL